MNRRDVLGQLAAVSTVASLPCLTGTAQAAPSIGQGRVQWRMASSFPKSLDAIYGAGEMLARRVAPVSYTPLTLPTICRV